MLFLNCLLEIVVVKITGSLTSEMIQYKLLLAFVLISQLTSHGVALNILVIVSLPLKSHYMTFQHLFRELSLRGHSVTVINNYPEKNPPKNLTFVMLDASLPSSFPPMSDFDNLYFHHLYNFFNFRLSSKRISDDCKNLFINNNMKEFHKKGETFDVIFVEQFMSDCGLVYAAVMYDAPIIGITSQMLFPWAYRRLGLPFDFASDTFYYSIGGTNPRLYNKVENFLMNFYMNTIWRWQYQRGIYDIFNQYVPNITFDIEIIVKEKMKMMFSYQHYSVTGARLLTPQVLEIGGIHIGKSKPVPEAIEKFISTAKHGVIYVSFGSNLKASTMSETKIQQFLLAFKKVPQKILWKLENMTLPRGNDNVYTHEWFPQLDVLCHPKVLAFVSHGGMKSLSEAAHCGKPLLAIPFFGDQFSNAAAIEESGLGSKYEFSQINADTLAERIQYLTSPKMQESAQRVSALWHDRPMNVMDSAIYWTEYVARHKQAPPALPSTRATWFQASLLDVYTVLIGLLLAIFTVIYHIFKLILVLLSKLFRFFVIKENGKKKRA